MIELTSPKQNLGNINVLIEDTSPSSVYFNMKVPDTIPGGKTAISIDPPSDLLKISSQVKVEVIDSAGNPVYVEFPKDPFVPAYEYGYSEPGSTARLLSITVYPDTPYGYGEIIVVGEAIKVIPTTSATLASSVGLIGLSIPPEWRGIYNVRWRKQILLNRNATNNSKIIFYKTPVVTVSEIQKSYLNQSYSAGRVVTLDNPSYFVKYDANSGYAIVTATGFTFTQDMVGGLLTVPSPQLPESYAESAIVQFGQYVTYIDSLINSTQAYVRDAYIGTKKVRTLGLTSTNTKTYLAATSFLASNFTLSYNAAPVYVSSPNLKSFAKFDVKSLDTFSGDVYRIKVFQSSDGTTSGFKAVGEKNLEDTEILFNYDAADPSSQYMGVFAGSQIFSQYWKSSSFDFNTNMELITPPIVTFDSNTLMNGMIISSSYAWEDVKGRIIDFIFPTTQSYFQKGDQLEVSFKLANLSGDGAFDVYASGSAFYQNPYRVEVAQKSGLHPKPMMVDALVGLSNGYENTNKFGKLITNFSTDGTGQYVTKKSIYGLISAPLQADQSGSGSILIAVRGGQWVVSDVSFVYKRDTNFSPSAFTFTTPLEPEQEGDSVSFGLKYYNKLGEEVIIPTLPSPNAPPNMTLGAWEANQNYGTFGAGVGASSRVTGPNTYIDGTRNVMSGSLWIGSQVGRYTYGDIIASGGMELSADSAPGPSGSIGKGVLFRSLGYQGWYRANSGFGAPGFMIWSGSILPLSGDNYSGVGIELWASGSGLRFDTTSGILQITGSVNASSGTIGGWVITPQSLVSPDSTVFLSSSFAGMVIYSTGVPVTYIDNQASWRYGGPMNMPPNGLELVTNGDFESLGASWAIGPGVGVVASASGLPAPGPHGGTYYAQMDAQTATPGPGRFSHGTIGPLVSQSIYQLSFWRAHAREDSGFFGAPLIYTASMVSGEIIDQQRFDGSIGDAQWYRYTYTFISPSNAFMNLLFATDRNGPARVYFDDVSLRQYVGYSELNANGLVVTSTPTQYVQFGKGLANIVGSVIKTSESTSSQAIWINDSGQHQLEFFNTSHRVMVIGNNVFRGTTIYDSAGSQSNLPDTPGINLSDGAIYLSGSNSPGVGLYLDSPQPRILMTQFITQSRPSAVSDALTISTDSYLTGSPSYQLMMSPLNVYLTVHGNHTGYSLAKAASFQVQNISVSGSSTGVEVYVQGGTASLSGQPSLIGVASYVSALTSPQGAICYYANPSNASVSSRYSFYGVQGYMFNSSSIITEDRFYVHGPAGGFLWADRGVSGSNPQWLMFVDGYSDSGVVSTQNQSTQHLFTNANSAVNGGTLYNLRANGRLAIFKSIDKGEMSVDISGSLIVTGSMGVTSNMTIGNPAGNLFMPIGDMYITGTINGGTNANIIGTEGGLGGTLDLSSNATKRYIKFSWPQIPTNPGSVNIGSDAVFSTGKQVDNFIQFLPTTASAWGIVESYGAHQGLSLGTGGGANPVVFRVNRIEQARATSTGFQVSGSSGTRILGVYGDLFATSSIAINKTTATAGYVLDIGDDNSTGSMSVVVRGGNAIVVGSGFGVAGTRQITISSQYGILYMPYGGQYYGTGIANFNAGQSFSFQTTGSKVWVGDFNTNRELFAVDDGTGRSRFTTSASDTTLFSRNDDVTLRNTQDTTNGYFSLGFYGAGNIAAGIANQVYDTANAYGRLYLATRGATGFISNNLVISDGQVGIGKTPTTTLDVTGSVLVSNDVTASGKIVQDDILKPYIGIIYSSSAFGQASVTIQNNKFNSSSNAAGTRTLVHYWINTGSAGGSGWVLPSTLPATTGPGTLKAYIWTMKSGSDFGGIGVGGNGPINATTTNLGLRTAFSDDNDKVTFNLSCSGASGATVTFWINAEVQGIIYSSSFLIDGAAP